MRTLLPDLLGSETPRRVRAHLPTVPMTYRGSRILLHRVCLVPLDTTVMKFHQIYTREQGLHWTCRRCCDMRHPLQ